MRARESSRKQGSAVVPRTRVLPADLSIHRPIPGPTNKLEGKAIGVRACMPLGPVAYVPRPHERVAVPGRPDGGRDRPPNGLTIAPCITHSRAACGTVRVRRSDGGRACMPLASCWVWVLEYYWGLGGYYWVGSLSPTHASYSLWSCRGLCGVRKSPLGHVHVLSASSASSSTTGK
jgi:hypothetical protein